MKYFSRAQAFAVCRDFQSLQGKTFEGGHVIEAVVVVPYSRILQWQYIRQLLNKSELEGQMPPENPAGRYDVVLLCRAEKTDRGFIAQDLRSYLAVCGITFEDARYACLHSSNIPPDVLSQFFH